MRTLKAKKAMAEFEKYRPAFIYRSGNNWEIHYYAFDPVINDVARKRMRINQSVKNLQGDRKKRQYATDVIKTINAKLQQGWSPFIDEERTKGYMLLKNAFNEFIADKRQEQLRPDTLRSYTSYIKNITSWLIDQNVYDTMFIISFKRLDALAFMNYLFRVRKVTNRTYNNYLSFMRQLWKWFIQQNYLNENPFENISPKKREAKTRTYIKANQRAQIKEAILLNNPKYILPCFLAYWGLVRRTEMCKIQIKHIDFNNRCIIMPPEITKTGFRRVIALTDELWTLFVQSNVADYPKNFFLLGTNFKPSAKPCQPKKISDTWTRLRTTCQLPKNISFYSLRDSGIIRLIELGMPLNEVAEHADHHDLTITSIYALHAKPKGVAAIKKITDNF